MKKAGETVRTNFDQAARVEVPDNLAPKDGRRACELAIPLLVPSGNRRQILALFQNRISWSGYRHWRSGRRGMPAWALAALEAHVRTYWRRYDRIADVIAATPAGPGKGWNKNATRGLGEWRARKNLEKR